MFTGIVEELGRVRSVTPNEGGARIEIEGQATLAGLVVGGSVAVNGCCLTAVEISEGAFSADAVSETLSRTSLGRLAAGDAVNIERPLRADGRLDGHMVQGHVDGVGVLEAREHLPDGSFAVRVSAPPALVRYIVEKGSIAVDGVSLTVVGVDEEGFSVALIPHTAEVTTLGHKPVGAEVNLEVDVVAKYVERLTRPWREDR
ncbi:MAG: riboflavin synthase [Actinobacteria bacterium]|nr:riboflavin synthase [Actinomycetota bacterium]